MKVISYKVWGNPKSTWLDKAISIVSFGNYSHTELVFSDGKSFSISPRDVIVRFADININSGSWDIIDIQVDKKTEAAIRAECEQLKKKKYKYDYIGALSSPLRLCIQRKDRYFCSELISYILNKYRVKNLDKGCKYTPVRLQKTLRRLSH